MKNKTKKILTIFVVVSIIFLLLYLIIFVNKDDEELKIDDYNKIVEYEALVVIRPQTGGTPEEDRANNLKRGDVIALQEAPIEWSRTELVSYLLVRLKDKKGEILKLLEPVEEKGEKREGTDEYEMITVQARKYYVDLDKVGFTGEHVISGQPLLEKQFDASVIKKK